MPITQAHQDFVAFMIEYTAFLGQMRQDESDKLAAIASKALEKTQHCLTVSQANAKQLANYEQKRMELQAAAGYEGLTFRQLIAQAPAQAQDELWQMFSRFEGAVADIRFYNEKSMAKARDNMIDIDPSAILPGQAGAKPTNPYEKIREEQSGKDVILETKA